MSKSKAQKTERWLVLLYQFPAQPGSLRMKIWRRLQRIGAVAMKNSAYVLPSNEQTREDFEWVLQEIKAGGADGTLLESNFIDEQEDQHLRAQFDAARNEDYEELSQQVREFCATLPADLSADPDASSDASARLLRFRKRFSEVEKIDFFGANGREATEGFIEALADNVARANHEEYEEMEMVEVEELHGMTWVTRTNVHVDRIASAWLVKQWIDKNAQFKFTPDKNYQPGKNEIRFDMFDAEITHEGDNCTFEVLLGRAGLDDPALKTIAEIIHDIDLKDAKYNRDETLGIEHLLAGLVATTESDEERLKQGGAIFDNLYNYFSSMKS